MKIIAGTAPAPTIDPTVLVLLSIFGGALLAGVIGLIGASIQRRSEHKKWLREKRYEAFVRARVYASRLIAADRELRNAEKKGDEEWKTEALQTMQSLSDELRDAMSAATILGPNYVDEAGALMVEAMRTADPDQIDEAVGGYIGAVRKALKIKD